MTRRERRALVMRITAFLTGKYRNKKLLDIIRQSRPLT